MSVRDVSPAMKAAQEAFTGQREGLDWSETNDTAVPDGSVADVISWVGDSDTRRQAALDAEKAKKPKDRRKSLISKLS